MTQVLSHDKELARLGLSPTDKRCSRVWQRKWDPEGNIFANNVLIKTVQGCLS